MIKPSYKKKIMKHYGKSIMRTNMAKTSTSSTIIASGVSVLATTLATGEIQAPLIICGSFLIGIGFLINYIGDIVKMRHKETELDMIAEAFAEALKEYQDIKKEEMKEEFIELLEKMSNEQ